MWVRKRVDIGWSDLAAALAHCLLPGSRAARAAELERLWSNAGDAIACLSVRSGFDLWLSAINLPAGSEVLVSAITIPDMLRIIQDHGLVPVPVDVDPDHLAVDPASLEQGLSPRTRAIFVAHLFGTRQPLDGVAKFARRHDLLLIEDCAGVRRHELHGRSGSGCLDVQLRADQDGHGARRRAAARCR